MRRRGTNRFDGSFICLERRLHAVVRRHVVYFERLSSSAHQRGGLFSSTRYCLNHSSTVFPLGSSNQS